MHIPFFLFIIYPFIFYCFFIYKYGNSHQVFQQADRRIWRSAIAAVSFCKFCYPKDFRFLRYSAISSSLTVSMMCCSSLATRFRSFGR